MSTRLARDAAPCDLPVPRTASSLALAGLSLLLAAGCGGTTTEQTDGAGSTTDMATGGNGDGGGSSVLVGTFQVRLVAPVPPTGGQPAVPGYTTFLGKVTDGPTPALIQWSVDTVDGVCTLSKPKVPFCNTPCGGSAACVADDKCQPYPSSKPVGTVTLKGVRTDAGATSIAMEPVVNNYQIPGGTSCPYPAFDEGAEIQVSAAGGSYAPFTITAKGIKPFDLTNPTPTLDAGKPVTLTWAAPSVMGISRVYVKLDISHHGGTKGMIECDAPDTGSVTISAALIDKLTALGVAGFPTVIAIRKAIGSTTIAPGRVDLVVSADVEKTVLIPGLTSCASTDDCPMGQTCQTDLTCK